VRAVSLDRNDRRWWIYSHDHPTEPSELALVTPEHTLIVWEYVRDDEEARKVPVIARRDDGKVRISGSSFFWV